jgi:TolB-like protein/cytochrome c-type biogenesis protein CcmH/NrfG
LVTGREKVRLDPVVVRSDVAEFLDADRAGDVRAAAELYRGDLLESVSLPGGAFDDWLLVERAHLRERAIAALGSLAAQQDGDAAIATCQRLLQLDAYREESHRTVMRLYAGQGNRSLALRQYQRCRDLLKRELGVEPDAETESLRHALLVQGPASARDLPPQPEAPRVTAPPPLPAGSRRRPALLVALAIAVFAVLAAILLPQQPAPAAKPLVAVLPFTALSGDATTARLARGLTEDIIADLGRVPEFGVLGSDTTRPLAASVGGPAEAGRSVGAGFVVDGSIQREGDNLRITAQLIETGAGTALWTERWDRPAADLFAIQAEIAETVANRLGGGNGLVQESGRIAAHRKPPANLSAYDLYLLGTEKLEQITRADVDEAIRLLNRAVEIDPGLARAWVELHHAHAVAANFGNDMDSHYKLAIAAAGRAIELDPSDAEAHVVYAMSFGYQNDLPRAKAEFDKALRMAPNQFEILAMYISWASTFGEAERGAALIEEAIRLNPNYPHWAARYFAFGYFMTGRYEEALAMMDRVDESNLGTWLWPYRAGALAAVGRHAEAKAAVAEALRLFPDLTVEGTANEPGYNDAERQRLIETMRMAGFPPCAKPEVLAQVAEPLRLPECTGP